MSDRARVHELAAEGSERCAEAHDAYARFMELHGDLAAAEEHRRRSSASRSQAADHRRRAAEAAANGSLATIAVGAGAMEVAAGRPARRRPPRPGRRTPHPGRPRSSRSTTTGRRPTPA